MVFKVSLFITLIALAILFAVCSNWLATDQTTIFVFKVGVVSSIVAAIALIANR
jgi:hypothetical protein